MDPMPFDIPPEEISDRAASYRQQLEHRKDYLTPAEQDWLDIHMQLIQSLKDG